MLLFHANTYEMASAAAWLPEVTGTELEHQQSLEQ